jgi:sec-independent protein translocase protein TatA
MLANIGPTEIIIIAVVVLILFGGGKLAEMGKGLGESVKEFKNAFGSKKSKD